MYHIFEKGPMGEWIPKFSAQRNETATRWMEDLRRRNVAEDSVGVVKSKGMTILGL